MTPIKATIDAQTFTRKPTGAEIARISTRIADRGTDLDTPENIYRLAYNVGVKGQTFCPATFSNGKRCKENFEQQQLFALDFDNKDKENSVTFRDIKSRAEHYELPVLFAYETFSSTQHDKFRVVFMNDVSVSDRPVSEAMQYALSVIFPEADKSCANDVSKMYFGGNHKDSLYFDNSIPKINIDSLFRSMTFYVHNAKGDKHYKEKLRRISSSTGIALNDFDSDRFRKLTHKITPELEPVQNDESADLSMISKGMAVRYRDSLYKEACLHAKKYSAALFNGNKPNNYRTTFKTQHGSPIYLSLELTCTHCTINECFYLDRPYGGTGAKADSRPHKLVTRDFDINDMLSVFERELDKRFYGVEFNEDSTMELSNCDYLQCREPLPITEYRLLIMEGSGDAVNGLPSKLITRLKIKLHRLVYIELEHYRDGQGVVRQCYNQGNFKLEKSEFRGTFSSALSSLNYVIMCAIINHKEVINVRSQGADDPGHYFWKI